MCRFPKRAINAYPPPMHHRGNIGGGDSSYLFKHTIDHARTAPVSAQVTALPLTRGAIVFFHLAYNRLPANVITHGQSSYSPCSNIVLPSVSSGLICKIRPCGIVCPAHLTPYLSCVYTVLSLLPSNFLPQCQQNLIIFWLIGCANSSSMIVYSALHQAQPSLCLPLSASASILRRAAGMLR